MGVLGLIIINKAGGLVYNRTFGEGLNQLNTNDYLVLAGTFHGVHAITARLNPLKGHAPAAQTHAGINSGSGGGGGGVGSPPPGEAGSLPASRAEPASGLEVMESENFRLQCFSSLTGTKFLLFTDTMQGGSDAVMRRVHDLYADYVMKNPFYQIDMPVRCESFDRRLGSYVREVNSSSR